MLFRGRILQFGTADDIIHSTEPAIRQFINGSLDGPIQMV
jgi:phospholipid/cholesterol/gamma-HCH transport system ATP-binding protein